MSSLLFFIESMIRVGIYTLIIVGSIKLGFYLKDKYVNTGNK